MWVIAATLSVEKCLLACCMQTVSTGTETRTSVSEDARITATVITTAHIAAPRAPRSVDPLWTPSSATGRAGARPSARGSATTLKTTAVRHASNTRPTNQVSASAYRPLSTYLLVCLSVSVWSRESALPKWPWGRRKRLQWEGFWQKEGKL